MTSRTNRDFECLFPLTPWKKRRPPVVMFKMNASCVIGKYLPKCNLVFCLCHIVLPCGRKALEWYQSHVIWFLDASLQHEKGFALFPNESTRLHCWCFKPFLFQNNWKMFIYCVAIIFSRKQSKGAELIAFETTLITTRCTIAHRNKTTWSTTALYRKRKKNFLL